MKAERKARKAAESWLRSELKSRVSSLSSAVGVEYASTNFLKSGLVLLKSSPARVARPVMLHRSVQWFCCHVCKRCSCHRLKTFQSVPEGGSGLAESCLTVKLCTCNLQSSTNHVCLQYISTMYDLVEGSTLHVFVCFGFAYRAEGGVMLRSQVWFCGVFVAAFGVANLLPCWCCRRRLSPYSFQ